MSSSSTIGAFTFAAAKSTDPSSTQAAADTIAAIREQLGTVPDIIFVFLSVHHAIEARTIASSICEALQCEKLIGCTAESIVAGESEIEGQPALSVWAACLPGVATVPMHLRFEQTPDGNSIVGWPDELVESWPPESSLIVLGDPFSFPTDLFLENVNNEHPGTRVVGGMSSGGASSGDNRLLLGGEVVSEGAVAVLMHGPMSVRTIVSQGCRPIGKPFVVTKAERNVIYELGGLPALGQLQRLFETMPNREQAAAQQGLHLGRVVSEYQDRFEQGDFLVRNVMGVDPDNETVVIGDQIRTGQTVQFHIRDKETASAEMGQMLRRESGKPRNGPRGALLFTCNGRGTRLFGKPNHDAGLIQEVLGGIPLAGFFAQGEIGPVGGENFVHGFTASIAVFEQDPA